MNARLIELAEQAGITTNLDTDYFERDMNKWVDYYSEKFAELVVQECKDIAFRRGDNVDYLSLQLINNEVDDARADMDAQIKASDSRFSNFAEGLCESHQASMLAEREELVQAVEEARDAWGAADDAVLAAAADASAGAILDAAYIALKKINADPVLLEIFERAYSNPANELPEQKEKVE